jgi:ribonuclease P protein component
MDERLRPFEKIRKKKDFLAIYRAGSRYRGRFFHIVYRDNPNAVSRMAVVVSRKVGNAVRRNRIKRRIRALFRKNKQLFKRPADVILIARAEITDLSRHELAAEYLSALNWIFRERSAP